MSDPVRHSHDVGARTPIDVVDAAQTLPSAEPRGLAGSLKETLMRRFQVRSLAKQVADMAVVRPVGYVVRRLGFRQDVITRVKLLAADDSARYVLDTMMPCGIYDARYPLFDLTLSKIPATGLLLEFGVFNGRSINYVGKRVGGRPRFGFDSFEGLAEDWVGTGLLKRSFDRGGTLPKVVDNVTLVKGWFNQTLPPFLDANPGPIAFAHLDADTYESTRYVLDRIAPRFKVGTVLQFDEYLGYPGWRFGEYLAWKQVCAEHRIKYRYLGVGWMSVALEITEIG
jgi:hypothetical protein